MTRVYATRADLLAYTAGMTSYAVPAEPEATRVLTRASQRLDATVLRTAIYDTDDVTGLPTDTDVIAAIRDATCAQVVWWAQTGSETGANDQYGDVAIGSVRLGRGKAGSGTASSTPAVAPAVADHLADLTPGVVTTYGAWYG